MRTRSRHISLKQGLLARHEILFIFITLFPFVSECSNGSWSRKWKIQKLSKIQKEGYFSFTSGISGSVLPIYSSAWLFGYLYHAHNLSFHSISDLFLQSCYSVTTMQLFKSYVMFFPGKLIILKIFYCLPGGVFLAEDFFFFFLQQRFCPLPCSAKSLSALLLRTPSVALPEVNTRS